MCFDFTKMVPKIKVQTFSLEIMFYLVLSGQVRGSLGIRWNLGKMVLEVPWVGKMRPTWIEMQSLFWGYFLWVVFGQVWGNLGKNPSNPQHFACSHNYAVL